jgi:hypothetical protein
MVGAQGFTYDEAWVSMLDARGPNHLTKDPYDCQSCKVVSFQNDKTKRYCDFCGFRTCKDCL